MSPGETRTWIVGDRKFTLTRTHRPYNYDLADAYNAERKQRVIDGGGLWIPTPGGGVALIQSRSWTEDYTKRLEDRAEEERERWKYWHSHPDPEQQEMFDPDSTL